jgi:ATP-dependent DNA ligase
MLQRALPAGFVSPCLPTKTDKLPSGSEWLHEIKHDGFRVIARKKGPQVRLYSRPGNDLTYRFPLIVETLVRLPSRSCIIDGEAVACDDNGVTPFNRVRYRHMTKAFCCTPGAIPGPSSLAPRGDIIALPGTRPSLQE